MACLYRDGRVIISRKKKEEDSASHGDSGDSGGQPSQHTTEQILLDYAQNLAAEGKFPEALCVYRVSSRRKGTVDMDNVRELTKQMINHYTQLSRKRDRCSTSDPWSCSSCSGVLCEPVTMPCGHTACKNCVLRDLAHVCRKCGRKHDMIEHDPINEPEYLRVSILISDLVTKFWSKELKALDLRTEGNRIFQRGDVAASILKYTEAHNLTNTDHMVTSNRSNAYYKLERYQEALDDANLAIESKPDWGKGYFRKGTALVALENYGEALVAFFQCLVLERSCSKPLKTEINQVLFKILESQQHHDDDAQDSSSLESREGSLAGPLLNSRQAMQAIRLEPGVAVSAPPSPRPADRGARGSLSSLELAASLTSLDSAGTSTSTTSNMTAAEWATASQLIVPRNKYICRTLEVLDEEVTQLISSSWQQTDRNIPPAAVDPADYECSLCFRMLWQPMTTSCGHTYCRSCLDRSLDHKRECPLCKTKLNNHDSSAMGVNEFLEQTIRRMLPKEFVERQKLFEEEMVDMVGTPTAGRVQVPVFVCTIAFPNIPCPLHVFEPRYRLMIRRCMESGSREFGMCLHHPNKPFADIGTMLEVRDIQYFQDGRSVVDTVGGRRFRVVERGSKDGYNTAVVEFLKDEIPQGQELQELMSLHDKTRLLAVAWFTAMEDSVRTNVTAHYGAMPGVELNYWSSPSGPAWLWWVLAILPLDSTAQTQILSHVQLKKRVEAIAVILNYMQRTRGGGGSASE